MSEQYQEDTSSSSSKKPVKPKHSFKKAFSRHSQSTITVGDDINPASVLLNDLINTLTSLYMNTKKQ